MLVEELEEDTAQGPNVVLSPVGLVFLGPACVGFGGLMETPVALVGRIALKHVEGVEAQVVLSVEPETRPLDIAMEDALGVEVLHDPD